MRANTWPSVNEELDRRAKARLRHAVEAANPDAVSDEIAELDSEWDFDRVLETEASVMGFTGLVLAATVDRRFLLLPAFVAAMMLVHATHGWYPLLPLFRRIGVRSRDEIDRERYALKAVRGDFSGIPPSDTDQSRRAAAAWEAVRE